MTRIPVKTFSRHTGDQLKLATINFFHQVRDFPVAVSGDKNPLLTPLEQFLNMRKFRRIEKILTKGILLEMDHIDRHH
ncbi:MAG: hypothetical protein AMS26_04260 [Bacteroides sp. SM23_62]|nr:MAG: hypothetical protein AMS26_04260 [Bacteroides sp. SM23_62]